MNYMDDATEVSGFIQNICEELDGWEDEFGSVMKKLDFRFSEVDVAQRVEISKRWAHIQRELKKLRFDMIDLDDAVYRLASENE